MTTFTPSLISIHDPSPFNAITTAKLDTSVVPLYLYSYNYTPILQNHSTFSKYYQQFIAVGINRHQELHYINPYSFHSNGTLTDHSFEQTKFMQKIESLLSPGGLWYKWKIVWAGNYADFEKMTLQNLYNISDKVCDDNTTTTSPQLYTCSARLKYVVNHTKKLYVDKDTAREMPDGCIYHPLPFLTCEGINRANKPDYRGIDVQNILGKWARDCISMEYDQPGELYQEIDFDLYD